jgi:hypothetical protein
MITPNDRAFGFDYPMGAERDPRAPWNQKEDERCIECERKCDQLNEQYLCPDCQHVLDEEGPQKP